MSLLFKDILTDFLSQIVRELFQIGSPLLGQPVES